VQWQGTTGCLMAFENNVTNHAVCPAILGAQSVVSDTTTQLWMIFSQSGQWTHKHTKFT